MVALRPWSMNLELAQGITAVHRCTAPSLPPNWFNVPEIVILFQHHMHIVHHA